MLYSFSDNPKQWNNNCPKCGSAIKWTLHSSQEGARSVAYCANSLSASRTDIVKLRELMACSWKGYVIRQKDGGVRFLNENSKWLKE
jgi:hypothetical protein